MGGVELKSLNIFCSVFEDRRGLEGLCLWAVCALSAAVISCAVKATFTSMAGQRSQPVQLKSVCCVVATKTTILLNCHLRLASKAHQSAPTPLLKYVYSLLQNRDWFFHNISEERKLSSNNKQSVSFCPQRWISTSPAITLIFWTFDLTWMKMETNYQQQLEWSWPSLHELIWYLQAWICAAHKQR